MWNYNDLVMKLGSTIKKSPFTGASYENVCWVFGIAISKMLKNPKSSFKKSLQNNIVSTCSGEPMGGRQSDCSQKTLAFVLQRLMLWQKTSKRVKKYCITYQSKKITGMHIILILLGVQLYLIWRLLNFQRNMFSSTRFWN